MGWNTYKLDQTAQKLVLDAKRRDPDSLNQGHKMRMTTAYGLERFWGEQLRLAGRDQAKADYWKSVWTELVTIMGGAGVTVPNRRVDPNNETQIRAMAQDLWAMDLADQRVTLAVLTALCDAIVWWTQRYKG
jgi:hypothetical protein